MGWDEEERESIRRLGGRPEGIELALEDWLSRKSEAGAEVRRNWRGK